MTKLGNEVLIKAFLVIVAAFLTINYVTNMEGSPFAVTGALEASIAASGVCPANGASSLCFAAKNTVAEPDTALAVTVNGYTNGKTTPAVTLTTLTTADICSNGTVNCKNGETYRAILGDGPTQYHRYSDANDVGTWLTADHALMRADVPMYVVGSAAITFSNTSDFGQTAVGLTLGSGQDDGTVTMRVRENTADAYFGVPGQLYDIVTCFNFSTANFTSVHLSGDGVTQNVGLNTIAAGFEMCDGYNAPNDISDWGWVDIPIQIDTIAGVNPGVATAAPTNISIMTFDWGTWVKDGEIMFGAQNGDTLAAIGATDVTSTQAIRVR
jgi:hypothetical protein